MSVHSCILYCQTDPIESIVVTRTECVFVYVDWILKHYRLSNYKWPHAKCGNVFWESRVGTNCLKWGFLQDSIFLRFFPYKHWKLFGAYVDIVAYQRQNLDENQIFVILLRWFPTCVVEKPFMQTLTSKTFIYL